MKPVPRRFELWHTIATLFALNLCVFLTLSPLDWISGAPSNSVPLDRVGWLWVPVALGFAGCVYLLMQLWEQGTLLVNQAGKSRRVRRCR